MLPNQPKENMRLMFVAGTHSSPAIQCMYSGSATIHPEPAGDDGCYDKRKIIQRQASMQKPLEEGVPTLVCRQEIETEVLKLPGFIADAANKTHGTERADTTVQTL